MHFVATTKQIPARKIARTGIRSERKELICNDNMEIFEYMIKLQHDWIVELFNHFIKHIHDGLSA